MAASRFIGGRTAILVLLMVGIGILAAGCHPPLPGPSPAEDRPASTSTHQSPLHDTPTSAVPRPSATYPYVNSLGTPNPSLSSPVPPYPELPPTSLPIGQPSNITPTHWRPPIFKVTRSVTLIPTRTPILYSTPWQQLFHPVCNQGGMMQTCVDDLLQIQFKVPNTWGEIEGVLRKGDTGKKYFYQFSGNDRLSSGGLSRDFSEGRDRFFTDFWGFFGLDHDGICRLYVDVPICEEIKPDVYLFYLFPDARYVCDPGPGSVGYPLIILAIDLPHNETINGFVFVDELLAGETKAELKGAFVKLLGPGELPDNRGCNEAGMAAFDARVESLIERIQHSDVDRDTLNVIDMWHRVARSIRMVRP